MMDIAINRIIILCAILFMGCSSADEEPSLPITAVEETPIPEPNVHDDINKANLTLDIGQMYVAGANIPENEKAVVTGGRKVPYALSFSLIEKEHFNGLTPESVEARKTLEIHSILGQAQRISGDEDIEVVGIGENDGDIGNIGITYVIDRPDDDLPPNGIVKVLKSLKIVGATYSTPLNGSRNYNSRQIEQLELEFSLFEGSIAISPDGTGVETIKFVFNSQFSLPDGLYNYNYLDSNFANQIQNTLDIYTIDDVAPKEIPINVSMSHTSDGRSNEVVRTEHYSFGD